jgi:hypothetical protein
VTFHVRDLAPDYQADVASRLWGRVLIDDPDACWVWQGPPGPKGYGVIGVHHRPRYVHRVSYELTAGPIPDELTIDHLCRNRLCVNPDHLEPVTRGENVLRGESSSAIAARRDHCAKGHPYDERTWVSKQGKRHCRTCTNERALSGYHRRKAAA